MFNHFATINPTIGVVKKKYKREPTHVVKRKLFLAPGIWDKVPTNPGGPQALGNEFLASVTWVIQGEILPIQWPQECECGVSNPERPVDTAHPRTVRPLCHSLEFLLKGI